MEIDHLTMSPNNTESSDVDTDDTEFYEMKLEGFETDDDFRNNISESKEKKPLKILEEPDLRRNMLEVSSTLAEIYKVDLSSARDVLQKNNWDLNRVLAADMDSRRFDTDFVKKPSSSFGDECPVCFEFGQVMSLQCGHLACEMCWETYLSGQVENGKVNIECMAGGCDAIVGQRSLLACIDPSLAPAYHQFVMINFVQSSGLRQCPNAACKSAIRTTSTAPQLAICSCGYRFCLSCSRDYHQPLDCRTMERWAMECQQERERERVSRADFLPNNQPALVNDSGSSSHPTEVHESQVHAQGDLAQDWDQAAQTRPPRALYKCRQCSNLYERRDGLRKRCGSCVAEGKLRLRSTQTGSDLSLLPVIRSWEDRLKEPVRSDVSRISDEGPNVFKLCPNCKTAVWKDGGCNYMACGVCRHRFFWSEVKKIGESSKQSDMERDALSASTSYQSTPQGQLPEERTFQFYRQHFESLGDSLKAGNITNNINLLTVHGKSSHDFAYFQQSLKTLIESRRCLMYTYPLAFFLESNKMLLENDQERVHGAIRELANMLDNGWQSLDKEEFKDQVQRQTEVVRRMTQLLRDRVEEGYEKKTWQLGE